MYTPPSRLCLFPPLLVLWERVGVRVFVSGMANKMPLTLTLSQSTRRGDQKRFN
jgi:hypothetical protein